MTLDFLCWSLIAIDSAKILDSHRCRNLWFCETKNSSDVTLIQSKNLVNANAIIGHFIKVMRKQLRSYGYK
jgi:hypothetical protein